MAHDYSDVRAGHVMDASEGITTAIRTAFTDEHTADQLTDAILAIVDNLNRNELAAVLASFVCAHYHLDPEGQRQ
ncbi:hypothetical protein [Gordonia rubripertincta]|uniref:hypothetical protein n=1 Tax=Gordonia rubripertincta TaxID=36822 RepID=UPI0015F81506|nr:hypothetical protein [Gordonia rubripertincta]QMU22891.1 hypothetical protein H3V45_10675 [Gordonia rubripertincta]